MSNLTKAVFTNSEYCVAETPLWQFDYGQQLQILGIELPDVFEAHFSNDPTGESKTQIGEQGIVNIPDEYLLTSGYLYVWVYLHSSATDGETRYQIKIKVRERATPTDTEPTPQQQDVITEAIAALNEGVSRSETAANLAEQAKQDAETSKDEAKQSEETAKEYKDSAADSATEAAHSKQDSETASQNARQSEENASDSESNARQYAQLGLQYKNQAETAARQTTEDVLATQLYKQQAEQSASNASTYKNQAETAKDEATDQAVLARSYAKGDTETRQGEETDNAKYYKETAGQSEQNASGSATAAKNSENLSKSYAKGGSGTRTGEDTDNAKYYKEKASEANEEVQQAKQDIEDSISGVAQQSTAELLLNKLTDIGEQIPTVYAGAVDARDAAVLAKQGAEEAKDASVTAKGQAEQAVVDARQQANSAAGSSTSANNSAILSQSYAKGGTSTRTGEDTDNSKYYKEQAGLIKDDVESAKTDIQNSINGVAQQTTAQQIVTLLMTIAADVSSLKQVVYVDELPEIGGDGVTYITPEGIFHYEDGEYKPISGSGDLNGFSLNLGDDNLVVLSYKDPDDETVTGAANLASNLTAQGILAQLRSIVNSLAIIAGQNE